MGIPPEHTILGKDIRVATAPGRAVAKAEEEMKAANAEEDKKKALIANQPDLTELVIRANRNLRALQGRSALSSNSQLAGNAAQAAAYAARPIPAGRK
jgi:hypothetical protein